MEYEPTVVLEKDYLDKSRKTSGVAGKPSPDDKTSAAPFGGEATGAMPENADKPIGPHCAEPKALPKTQPKAAPQAQPTADPQAQPTAQPQPPQRQPASPPGPEPQESPLLKPGWFNRR